ncbi:hypothetical protein [Thermaurantiacus sp.]
MIGQIVTALAGRSLARTVGGTGAGPIGAVVGAALPTAIPFIARRLGPVGMVAAAVGSYVVARALARRAGSKAAPPPPPPQA